jgi:hypothetical protein
MWVDDVASSKIWLFLRRGEWQKEAEPGSAGDQAGGRAGGAPPVRPDPGRRRHPQRAGRVTRYDPISKWEIDMGDQTSMRYR